MLLEKNKNVKNSFLDYIRYKQLNWYGHVKEWMKNGYLEQFWNSIDLEEEEQHYVEICEYRK